MTTIWMMTSHRSILAISENRVSIPLALPNSNRTYVDIKKPTDTFGFGRSYQLWNVRRFSLSGQANPIALPRFYALCGMLQVFFLKLASVRSRAHRIAYQGPTKASF